MRNWFHFLVFISLFSIIESIYSATDSTSLFGAIKGGSVSGYSRTFFMATQNEGTLKDWSTLATGGLLKYSTNNFYHFSAEIGFYQSSNLMINKGMLEKDTSTGKYSRYETGLYDLEDLSKKQISLLGELALIYKREYWSFKFGRFKLKSPFLNPEDGRMIPTLVQGGWLKYKPNNFLFIQGGFISHIAVRGTSRYHSVQNSIGIYPMGKSATKLDNNYHGNLSSNGMGVFNLDFKKKQFGIKMWDYYVDNIFNTSLIEPYVSFSKNEVKHTLSLQHIYETKLNNGGNIDFNKTYFQDKSAQIYGAQYKTTTKKWAFSVNWNYITGQGKFLFPREWGREFLFVFQKRERLEGVSNTHAWMVDAQKKWLMNNKRLLIAKLGYGQYLRPDAKNFVQNKYAMPANDQLNIDLFFYARKDKKGLGLEWLTTLKRAIGDTYDNPNFILNKVNMINHNIVIHYRF